VSRSNAFIEITERVDDSGDEKLSCAFFFPTAQRYKGLLGEWRYNSTHSLTSALDGCEWSAFTTHPQGNSPWDPFDRRLDGPQSRSGRSGEDKNSQPQPGIEP
jgi:hypothetical protein